MLKYEEILIQVEDFNEENLSKIISQSENKKMLHDDELIRRKILSLFEPTEMM